MTLHPTDIERLAAERTNLQAQIEPTLDRIEAINQELRDSLEPGTYEAGNLTVTIKVGRRFDKTNFVKDHPVAEHPDWYDATPNLKAIQHDVPPSELDGYYVNNKPSVVIS